MKIKIDNILISAVACLIGIALMGLNISTNNIIYIYLLLIPISILIFASFNSK